MPNLFTSTTARIVATVTAATAAAVLLAGCVVGGDPIGTWRQQPAPTTGDVPQLVLETGGGLSGTDGCNIFGGAWTGSGRTVEFEDVIGTLIACEDVDDWLRDAAGGTVEGDTLKVVDASGAVIGELQRVS